jgi:hypothetical protein
MERRIVADLLLLWSTRSARYALGEQGIPLLFRGKAGFGTALFGLYSIAGRDVVLHPP